MYRLYHIRNFADSVVRLQDNKIKHLLNASLFSQVVAVAARGLERAQEFAKKHNIPKAYGNYEELANDPAIDVVYVHPCHFPACLLYMNARKNLLCEKPFSTNSGELIASARKNNVFLMEAMWTRFFPASREISRILSQGELGEVKVARAEFGVPSMHVPRSVEKELGGGALMNIGVYCVQFALMVFDGERPETIQASGFCLDSGVDEAMVVTLTFSRNRIAVCICSVAAQLPNEAVIVGTKGSIKIPANMWCPTALVVNGKEEEYPLPQPSLPLNFVNSTGLRYEAEEVRQCLLKGLKESSRMSLSDSALLMEIMDEARRQVGVLYSQDIQ
ncbi:trans-1,2-dihydrobenzene-1,2-diol dehydrogenase isoform X4 [Anguilla rostrata]|uniref:trans-1,2-dihydrobenzene-1,2-diol dehydrogenase isoform X4 n=1 Tax=Anguilla rostrata TaxID=7938 RepID=UPI0030CDE8AA